MIAPFCLLRLIVLPFNRKFCPGSFGLWRFHFDSARDMLDDAFDSDLLVLLYTSFNNCTERINVNHVWGKGKF